MPKPLLLFIKAFVVTSCYWVWSSTWRIRHVRRPVLIEREAVICGHWHGDELLLVGAFRKTRMAVMVSRSRDGALMAQLLSWLGYWVVRGSSTRGGVGGLKGLVDLVRREHRTAAFAVDGPHGPRFEVKPGILWLGQNTSSPILLGAAAAEHQIVFKRSWNRCFLPLPFSRCVIIYSEPLTIPAELDEEQFENWRKRIETMLLQLKRDAENYFSGSRVVVGESKTLTGCSAGG